MNPRGILPVTWQVLALLFCLGGGYLSLSGEYPVPSWPGEYISHVLARGYPRTGVPPPKTGVTPEGTWVLSQKYPPGRNLGPVTGVPPGRDLGPVEVLWDGDGLHLSPRCGRTDNMKTLPCPIFRMRAVKTLTGF